MPAASAITLLRAVFRFSFQGFNMIAYCTVVLCCLIPFVLAPIGFYLSLVSAALFGQTYRESVSMVEAPTANQDLEVA